MKKLTVLGACITVLVTISLLPTYGVQAQVEDPPATPTASGVESQSSNSVVASRLLAYGDNLIHGLVYYDGYLWASTRTSPARVLKIDPRTLNYQRITLSYGLNYGEDIEAAEGAIWVILYTNPARLIKVNPSDLSWQVALTFSDLAYGGALDYSYGYLWVGGYDRKIARVNLSNLTYQTYFYPSALSGTQFHAATSGGGYIWASAPTNYSQTSIVRINPNNPSDYASFNLNQQAPDDMAYRSSGLFIAGEQSPSNMFRVADDLTYVSALGTQSVAYGVFGSPYPNTVYAAYVGSPGYVVEYDLDLNRYYTHTFPSGLQNANEAALDPLGNLYVTAWQSPAGIVKFATVPSLLQTSLPWQGDPYGSYPSTDTVNTIKRWGCFMSSAAMIINYFSAKQNQDFRTTPRLFNDWLRSNSGYTPDSLVKWSKIVLYSRRNSIPLSIVDHFRGRDDARLDNALNAGHLAILGVNNGGHYVVALGKTSISGQTTYTINDPSYGRTTLSQRWGNTYSSALILGFAPTNRGVLGITAHSPVELLVTDPQGRRTGFDPNTGISYNEIPTADYFEDTLAPDGGSGTDIGALRTKSLVILDPLDGQYTIQIVGTGSGSYTVIASAANTGGNSIEFSSTGSTQPGQVDSFTFTYHSAVVYLPLVIR